MPAFFMKDSVFTSPERLYRPSSHSDSGSLVTVLLFSLQERDTENPHFFTVLREPLPIMPKG